MAGRNPKPKTRNSKASRLVPLLLDWFAINARDLPWRRTRNPYAIWVSEIMLQQTQVKTVIPFWERWMHELPTIQAAAEVNSAKLHKLWEGLGYYTRVRNLQKAAQVILEKHGGKFPENFDDVLALPGIGRYTAGAICSIAFNQPTPILDGNVIRVLTRIYGIGETPKEKNTNAKLWTLAEELVCRAKNAKATKENGGRAQAPSPTMRPSRETNACSHLNQSLMELGALICTPRNAQCQLCPVKKLCIAFKESRTEEFPNLGKRQEATARRFFAFAIEHRGKFLVQQRPAGIVNAHLWEFPNAEVGFKNDAPTEVLADLDSLNLNVSATTELKQLCTVKHSITRYRITLEAFQVSLCEKPRQAKGRWVTPAEFDSLAFSSAHKKLASAAAKSILIDR
jgi:A/G-specific adenine glycosylase